MMVYSIIVVLPCHGENKLSRQKYPRFVPGAVGNGTKRDRRSTDELICRVSGLILAFLLFKECYSFEATSIEILPKILDQTASMSCKEK